MYEGFPGEVKKLFIRGLMFPNEEEFSSALVHGALGSQGYSLPSGDALHSVMQVSSAFWRFPSTK